MRLTLVLTGGLFAAALLLAPVVGLAGKYNKTVSVGDAAPSWKDLEGTDGKKHALADFEKSKVVVEVFFSNHCFVAEGYEERLLKLARDYSPRGVQFVFISVSHLEEDNLEEMQKRATEKGYSFPYVQDLSQKSGKAYGATATPQVFVLNESRKIAYMGAVDDKWDDPAQVKSHYLRDALDAILDDKEPPVTETRLKGCAIEYQ